ncbi:hypothetical protein [Jeotgalibacillus campisalis]|uniref:Uncharacterized protein n=1 Tax=Jeotgalibacillus campisalis TaxID=220754 RepID=A0A0C2WAF9_9BACL|nr:hypothetical protein [Jeotgalibacillus campisalis]KIL53013.1 hypothetical protein KR50_03420 [Jeotgalibacillus campisalis]
MNLRKLDLVFSVILLLNAIRIFYIIVTADDPQPVDYLVLFFSTLGAVILFMNSRRNKEKKENE